MGNHVKSQVMELGNIYFFYRPKVKADDGDEQSMPKNKDEIQRFYLVLHPKGEKRYRLLLLGKKKLPDIKKHEKYWATVDIVTADSTELLDALKAHTYRTKTHGKRVQPEASPCGEGIYCIAKTSRQTYLVYHLELPEKRGEVQEDLAMEREASYVLSIKNQKILGTQSDSIANLPKKLQEKLSNLHFVPVDPTEFLNYPGAELLLIGTRVKAKDTLGISLPSRLNDDAQDLFKNSKLGTNNHVVRALFKREWL